jgi:hypothetical protein
MQDLHLTPIIRPTLRTPEDINRPGHIQWITRSPIFSIRPNGDHVT